MPPSTAPPPVEDHGDIEHIRETYKERVRTSSGASVRSHPSSRGSGSRSYSSSADSSYDIVERPYEDDIDPSDSASRSRHDDRYPESRSRPQVSRRHSSRRVVTQELDEPPRRRSSRRHHSSRRRRHESHRPPSDESSQDTVASFDDYSTNRHGAPPRGYPPAFRHVHAPGSHGGYPPSIVTSAPGYPDQYGGRQALVHLPQQDAFGYPVNENAFSPPDQRGNPFSPMSNISGPSYFAMDPHAPPMHHPRPPGPARPQSYMGPPSSQYGSEVMSPYGHPGMMAYPGYPMPHMPGYPMPGWYPPPSQHSSPPPAAPAPAPEPKEDSKSKEYEAISALLAKTEEARLAWQKEMVAKAAADAAAQAEKELKAAEEKKKKEEIADASKKAKEAAEKKADEALKKAKDEHEEALKKAVKAREEAEQKAKEADAERDKLKPPDHAGKSIKFKDAVDRKFSFPFHLCKTWKGMESLIKQAFLQIDVIGDHVRQGHYDLTGPDGEIILPQVWENMIQPDWEVSMHMWPMPEEEKKKKKKAATAEDDLMAGLMDPNYGMGLGDLGMGGLGIADPVRKKSTKKGDGKKKATKSADANIVNVMPDGLPAGYPPGMMDPFAYPEMAAYAGMVPPKQPKTKEKSSKSSSSKKDANSGLAAWFAGTSAPRPSKKDDEKLDLGRRKSVQSSHSGGRHSNHSHPGDRDGDRSESCVVM